MTTPAFDVATSMTIVRSTALADRHGDRSGSPTETPVDGCVWWPSGIGAEVTYQQQSVESDYDVLMPPGTDVLATDQVRWDDDLYQVVGRPERYLNPFTGTDPGVVVHLKLVT